MKVRLPAVASDPPPWVGPAAPLSDATARGSRAEPAAILILGPCPPGYVQRHTQTDYEYNTLFTEMVSVFEDLRSSGTAVSATELFSGLSEMNRYFFIPKITKNRWCAVSQIAATNNFTQVSSFWIHWNRSNEPCVHWDKANAVITIPNFTLNSLRSEKVCEPCVSYQKS